MRMKQSRLLSYIHDAVHNTVYPVWGTCVLSQWSGTAVKFGWPWCFLRSESKERLGLVLLWGALNKIEGPRYYIWDVVLCFLCFDISRWHKLGPSFHKPLSAILLVCLYHVWRKGEKKIIILREYFKMNKTVDTEIHCVMFVYPGNWVSMTVNRRWTPPRLCRCPETSVPVYCCPRLLLYLHQPEAQDREVCF